MNHPDSNEALLADSGYALTHRVLTPHLTATTEPQRQYTAAQIRARNSVERLFGVMKNRTSVIGKKMRYSPAKASAIFACCAIIHNYIKFCDKSEQELGVQLDNDAPDELPDRAFTTPVEYRDIIAQTYFG